MMRKSRRDFSFTRWVSVIFLFGAVLITVLQLVRFSRMRSNFPPGMVIAGVAVGGLDQQQAAERLTQAYSIPVELHYGGGIVQVKPNVVGFELKLETMITAADQQRLNQPFWSQFWSYLWNRIPAPTEIPLVATISEDRLRTFLRDEVAARYDSPPEAALPVAGTVSFTPGTPGTTLDINRAIVLVEDALRSPSARVVDLTFNTVTAPRPSYQNLQILVQQTMELAGYDGLAEIYILDLQNNQELHFTYQPNGNPEPDIAFTAASTMKIPIMVSVFKRLGEPLSDGIATMIDQMMVKSLNEPADALMKQVMDENLGPLQMTADMQEIGLENTFMAGYFGIGSPLLWRFETPANTRTDVTTYPDVYNQTTPLEMGMLLEDIYQCAETGGGTLVAAWPGDITQNECKEMVEFMARDKIGVMLQAGLPEGTRFAHKHGWVNDTTDYLIHQMSDVGIVYSPGGNYIVCLYMYHPVQLVFDPINSMVADISRAIYNYFNIGQ